MEGESCMTDEIQPERNAASEELMEERTEFSHRLASFGLGEKPGRLLEESSSRGARPKPRPATE